MNNEEKILNVLEQLTTTVAKMDARQDRTDAILEKMDARLSNLEQGQAEANARLSHLEQGQAEMRKDIENIKTDIEDIKEDASVTRTATNTLLDWAEKAEVQIRIPLYNKAE